MRSSGILTLFTEQPPLRRGPSSFLVSIVFHAVAFGLLFIGLRHAPRINDQSTQRYTVRLLNPPKPEPERPRPTGSGGVSYPGQQNQAHALAPGGSPAPQTYVPPQVAKLHPAPQTLVQPDAPPDLLLAEVVPIPVVVMWSVQNPPIQKLVPPPPQKPTVADVRPAIIKPNREPKLADLKITATPFPTKAPTLPPSTTSPLVVRRQEPAIKQVPQTASVTSAQPTPARVMSLSDIQSQGPVMVPLANQTAQSASSESLALGRPQKSSGEGSGNPASNQNGIGPGEGSRNQGDKAAGGTGSGAQVGANIGSGPGSAAGSGSAGGTGTAGGSGTAGDFDLGSNERSVKRITPPKDGTFGVVVVGSSLAEEYPETVEIWKGRLVYTVYLHVGLGKSWILQYSLPRVEGAVAAASITRPEAPWPYDILRPDLLPGDFSSDAVMVHGFINLAGTFERLALVFPPDFTQAKFLLDALKQWHFRPARQAGQIAAVEILLIIPEQAE
jgi:hypothetical protein